MYTGIGFMWNKLWDEMSEGKNIRIWQVCSYVFLFIPSLFYLPFFLFVLLPHVWYLNRSYSSPRLCKCSLGYIDWNLLWSNSPSFPFPKSSPNSSGVLSVCWSCKALWQGCGTNGRVVMAKAGCQTRCQPLTRFSLTVGHFAGLRLLRLSHNFL